VPRTFYRIVSTNPPTWIDFASNRLRGRAPRGAEKADPGLWDGISVYADRLDAARTARRYPLLGAFIAELEIPDDAPITIRQTFQPTHHTLQSDPHFLLEQVVGVSPVRV
jgi:hypothetical protein